jgi:quinoprotein glucose dehydrogenase
MRLLNAREATMLGLHRLRPVLLLTGAVVILLGLTVLGGGVWLVAIGGSPYYLLVGLG